MYLQRFWAGIVLGIVVLTFASVFLPKLTEASKAKKNDSKISTMTMPKTMPVQNLLRYISFNTVQHSEELISTIFQRRHLYIHINKNLNFGQK
jgi:peptidoglycan biosynthesis protein MviN/MurJ (putative lipid II flippase)